MKKENKFVLGILFGMVAIPVIEELLNVIFTWIEYLKILPSKCVLKGNSELRELSAEDEDKEDGEYSGTANAIGFEIPPEDDCYYSDEEDF